MDFFLLLLGACNSLAKREDGLTFVWLDCYTVLRVSVRGGGLPSGLYIIET